jgi:hypothetical protein
VPKSLLATLPVLALLVGCGGPAPLGQSAQAVNTKCDFDGAGGDCHVPICKPHCLHRQCGDDGCGDTCGDCAGGTTCNNAGQCQCVISDSPILACDGAVFPAPRCWDNTKVPTDLWNGRTGILVYYYSPDTAFLPKTDPKYRSRVEVFGVDYANNTIVFNVFDDTANVWPSPGKLQAMAGTSPQCQRQVTPTVTLGMVSAGDPPGDPPQLPPGIPKYGTPLQCYDYSKIVSDALARVPVELTTLACPGPPANG